jgi:hypothetical protein
VLLDRFVRSLARAEADLARTRAAVSSLAIKGSPPSGPIKTSSCVGADVRSVPSLPVVLFSGERWGAVSGLLFHDPKNETRSHSHDMVRGAAAASP